MLWKEYFLGVHFQLKFVQESYSNQNRQFVFGKLIWTAQEHALPFLHLLIAYPCKKRYFHWAGFDAKDFYPVSNLLNQIQCKKKKNLKREKKKNIQKL